MIIFKRRNLLPLLALLTIISACSGQTKPLPKEVLKLDKFDFDTKVTTLLPENTKDETYPDVFNVKNMSLQKFTVYDDEFSEDRKPIWIEYRQFHYRSTDELASFGKLICNSLNIATTLNGEIMLMNGLAGEVEEQESEQFIQTLNKLYGQAVKTEGEFMEPFDVYTWTLDDRLIKYVPLFDDEKSTMNIIIDKENKTLEGGERRPHYKGLIYIIDAQYSKELIGKFHTGDLLYCQ